MKLRSKLLLVALSILVLPWAGWQAARQMERLLRQGQEQALTASAEALARALALQPANLPVTDKSFLVHSLARAPLLDGHVDDWDQLTTHPYLFESATGQARFSLTLGEYNDRLYLYLQADDQSPQRGQAQWPAAIDIDAIELVITSGKRKTAIRIADRESQKTIPLGIDRQSLDLNIDAFWRELQNGYAIELALPQGIRVQTISLWQIDAAQDRQLQSAATANDIALYRKTAALNSALSALTPIGVKARVIDSDGWIIGRGGQLRSDITEHELTPSRRWLFRSLLLGDADSTDTVNEVLNAQRLAVAIPDLITKDQPLVRWQQDPNVARLLLTVAVPIGPGGSSRSPILLVQRANSDALLLTDRALAHLLGVTALAFFASVGVVLLFASRLSWRIRRLRDAAEIALDREGNVTRFIVSKDADEVGDLSRSFSRLLEEIDAYTAYLRSLAGKLSHELHTPLAIVRTSLDNLEQSGINPQAEAYLVRAREGTERMSALVRTMSEVTRIERAIESAEIESFDINKLITDVGESYREIVSPRRLIVAVPSSATILQGSADLIAQALDKLIENARGFCPPDGSISIKLQADIDSVLLSVENNGPLIPESMRARLFDSLVSLRERSRGEDGHVHLGFGLYVVKLIAAFHQGTAQASNRSDGSGVVISLRLRQAQIHK